MKTAILTLAAAALFSVTSVTGANNYRGLYKNTIVNEENRTKIIEVYEGNGQTLTPLHKYEMKMDAYGNPVEKMVYEWNGAWCIMHKYAYTIGGNGQVELMAYARWNEEKSAWVDMQYAIYNGSAKLLVEN
ncbi:MAG: DUF3836 domain-containing protein [Prevotella sp.]|jgi:hypothetical protein|nr:DUF3836 domain-containing protein [Prevotella sp.]